MLITPSTRPRRVCSRRNKLPLSSICVSFGDSLSKYQLRYTAVIMIQRGDSLLLCIKNIFFLSETSRHHTKSEFKSHWIVSTSCSLRKTLTKKTCPASSCVNHLWEGLRTCAFGLPSRMSRPNCHFIPNWRTSVDELTSQRAWGQRQGVFYKSYHTSTLCASYAQSSPDFGGCFVAACDPSNLK
ncbi:unnamed protein product [Ectocarpus fasciculatus]